MPCNVHNEVRRSTSRRAAALVLLLAVAAPAAAAAQDGDRLDTAIDDLETAADDILHIWTAPFRVELADVGPLLALTDAVILTGIYDGQMQQWIREHPESLPVRAMGPLRESQPLSTVGRTWTLLPLSGILYGAGLALESDVLRDAGIGCATSDVANTLARHSIARLIGRLRPESRRGPYVIEPLAFGDWPMRSFPGGHAANIMACTAFWNQRFEMGAVEPFLYVFAAAIGAARIVDEAHWVSDTVFGAAFGWAVGNAVAGRFLDREREEAVESDRRATRSPPLYFGVKIAVP